ncbi:Beta'-coat protein [Entamoeba marina]
MRTHLKYYLENRSERVKMVSFHPTATLLMCSLHDGGIQIWDYRTKILLNTFPNAHKGSIRGLSFHPNRPLVVSGGDDGIIRLWNYRAQKQESACVGELKGHTDYLRSTYFHPTKPWILSCSDDRTIRLWNYLSKKCIAILTGHDHYVLSTHFHPNPEVPLVISSSYDGTARVWDIKDLYENEPRGDGALDLAGSVRFNVVPEQYALNDAIFHPTLPLIFTCGDDKTVRSWRYNDSSCWSEGVYRGHTHNVTSCIATSTQLLTVSEDKCIMVFDLKSQKVLRSFRINGRIWCIAKHHCEDLFAVGCDRGLKVFKLYSLRPAYAVVNLNLYHVSDNNIMKYRIDKMDDTVLYSTEKSNSICAIPQAKEMVLSVHGITHDAHCSAFHRTALNGSSVCYIGGSYYLSCEPYATHLYQVDVVSSKVIGKLHLPQPASRISSVNRPSVFCVFYDSFAELRHVDGTVLFTTNVSGLKRAACSKDTVVLYGSKTMVVIKDDTTYQMTIRATEPTSVKSVIIAPRGVILYTTTSHLKYLLSTGETGIVQSSQGQVWYAVTIKKSLKSQSNGTTLLTVTTGGDVATHDINLDDVDFKSAVLRNDLAAVRSHLQKTVFIGDAVISFLLANHQAALALLFVRDNRAKFRIALESGDFPTALSAAKMTNYPAHWRDLATHARDAGYFKISEFALVQLGDFHKVALLAAYSGNQNSLNKLKALDSSKSNKLVLASLAGDRKGIVQLAFDVSPKLGYLAAIRHGFTEVAERIKSENEDFVGEKLVEVANEKTSAEIGFGEIINPLWKQKVWPRIGKERSVVEDIQNAKEMVYDEENVEFEGVDVKAIKGDKKTKQEKETKQKKPKQKKVVIEEPQKEPDNDSFEEWDYL